MPRGRKSGTTSKKSAKIASKSAERNARRLGMPEKTKTSEKVIKSYDISAIKTSAELLEALAAKETKITLGDNIITNTNILINHDLEIGFNGFSIISEEQNVGARVLDVRSGKVTLSGQGKVFAMGARSVAMRIFGAISAGVPHYTDIEIGKGISLYAPDSYGVLISPNLGVAYGVNVKLAGKIMAHDGICVASGIHGDEQNAPRITIEKTASIIVDENSGIAIEASGYGNWQIAEACLHGAVGVMTRTGILEFAGTKLLAHHGETFRIEDGAEKTLQIQLSGGTYLSEDAAVIGGLAEPIKKIALHGCELYSPLDEAIAPEIEACAIIKNCEFESDVAGYLESLIMSEATEATVAEAAESEGAHDEVMAAESAEATTESVAEVIEDTKTTKTAPEAEPELEELEFLNEDDFVDEMFEFVDELDLSGDKKFVEKKEKKSAKESVGLKVDSKSDLTPDLKPAPKLTDLSEQESEKSPEVQSKKVKKSKKLPKLAPAPILPFAANLDFAPELSDAETDEQEILLALQADEPELQPPLPAMIRPPMPADVSEQEAAKTALADAIAEIRKLSADDYDAGFSELERALQNAERILARPETNLVAIRDAAAALLQAFDTLEEHDDFALSDAELDELFYQGAVLEEMLRPQKKLSSDARMPVFKNSANSDSALVQTEITKVASGARTPQAVKTPATPEPDFAVLSEALTTISTIDLSKYTAVSQAALLEELDRAQGVLTNLQSTQAEIDEVATNLLAQMSRLEVQPRKHAAKSITSKTSAPAPVVNSIIPATMIDELSPSSTWSVGVMMIDELTPFVTDATTREKMLRAMRPQFKVLLETLASPFRKLARSIAAGLKAGVRVYRETLHANKF